MPNRRRFLVDSLALPLIVAPQAFAGSTESIGGTVAAVEADINVIVVSVRKTGDERRIRVDSAAKITLDGKPATLAELESGHSINLLFDLDLRGHA